jgi:hypothetical protein
MRNRHPKATLVTRADPQLSRAESMMLPIEATA